jgi:hypothetical protein
MKKFALVFGLTFAAVGAVITIIVLATLTSESFPFSFDFGMTVIAPSITVGRALGLQDGMHAWLWGLLAVFLNTFLCFSAGALLGFVVCVAVRGHSKSHDIAG